MAEERGMKFDGADGQGEEKLRWALLPRLAVEDVIRVLMYGARKYNAGNWRLVLDEPNGRERYYNAAMRHLTAWWDGETLDPESGHLHLSHAACCVLFLLWGDLNARKQAGDG
jgi:hypothetical protein